MSVYELVSKNRSYRRFYQDYHISEQELKELVELARLSPTGANLQALKYMLFTDAGKNAEIFATLGWAGYLKEWAGPQDGEQPSAYIVMLLDKSISKTCACDHGIASQSMLLGAVEKGLGGCILANIKRAELTKVLGIDGERYEILLVIALGKPKEEIKIVPVAEDGSIRYYRDEAAVHYVPKRSLDDIIIK